ncbi:MAG: hypothetical protein PSX36_05475 [bacterium]|nr:hypothetical protein [bacterium]
MPKKISAFLLIAIGVAIVIISIFALVKAFDVFSLMPSTAEGMGYAFGSILFPLLLTVIGRWMIRKGVKDWRSKN